MTHAREISLLAALVPCLGAADPVDFNRDVRPILTKNCTTCHGGVKMAGDVSYLYREDVLGEGKSGKIIAVPGKPEESEMIARLVSEDPDERMPPPDHHPEPLADEEIDTLRRWIAEGAEWGDHWAFVKPVEPASPEVRDSSWSKRDLDRFVLARLEAGGLAPSPAAPAEEWLRRASLDLTGLPPTPEEWEAFRQSPIEDPEMAMSAAVNRLLASPAFGERWASVWLDLARYADTFGFEKDPHRDVWPYRDWVIGSLNDDMPFDEFTVRQLAGDLLENPEPGDLIATAFHRNTQNNSEGGTSDEEFRMAAVIDRVNTTWTAWNATTFGCIQCHAHPYDAIPHEDYYRFAAFFNNSEDVDLNSDYPRTKVANDPAMQAEAVRLEKVLGAARERLNSSAREQAVKTAGWKPFIAATALAEPDTGRVVQRDDGDFVSSGTNPNHAVFTLTGPAESFAAIRIGILPENDDPARWDEQGAVVSGFDAALVGADGSRRPVVFREVVSDFLAGPFDPNESLKDGPAGFGEYPMMKGPRSAWIVPNEPVVALEGDLLEIRIRHGAVCNSDNQNCVLRRFRIELSGDPSLAAWLASPERAAAWSGLNQLQAQYNGIPGLAIPVMLERSSAARRETRVFIRGNRTMLDHPVTPGIPALVGGPPEAADRLDMARWLVGPDNPLAARVLANRLWAELFGTGIVETLEDFGSSGALPSHPELLDHLALRLRDHHRWQLKPFLKDLVLSATYRQSHKATPEMLELDPRNRLLARGPRQRLSAEMVRDQALRVSGLLSTKVGGPPVYPPQPDGIWKSVYNGQTWQTSEGEDRYRRAIYTYVKRTSGYPGFLTFDAPTRDLCSARRLPTNTPLQALVTLNDPAHIEFARAFAERMSEAGAELPDQLDRGYRLLTLKPAPAPVLDTLTRLHADTLADLESRPDESAKLAPTPAEAALVMVANTLLNSDLALNR